MSNNTYKIKKQGSKVEELLNKIDVLSKDDIGLDQVNNTSDADKPVSTLQRQALNEVLKEAKQYTDKEIAEFDFIKIVSVLPNEGLPNRIYLVPKTEVNENNLFDEYLWVNNDWEWIATKSVDVDLTDVYSIKEVDDLLDDKVNKVNGKGLSTNDYTNEEKEKLAGLKNIEIVDDLISTDKDKALSAKQGNELFSTIGGINASLSGQLYGHTNDNEIHVTEHEKTVWNSKVDKEEGKGLSETLAVLYYAQNPVSGAEESSLNIVDQNQILQEIVFYNKKQIDNKLGDIDSALDNIIAIKNELIGGDSE